MSLDKPRYDLSEAARLLSLSVRTLDRRIEKGRLLGAYKDGRKVFIPRESIIEYQKRLQKL